MVLLLAAFIAPVPAEAADGALPTTCGQARLSGEASAVEKHSDGTYTPVLLVHGFEGSPDMWSKVIDHSTLPGPMNAGGASILGNLRRLSGAALYTLDYHAVADRWLTRPGAGGALFVEAMDCLLARDSFRGHRLVVVAHSMGGLVTRWAVTGAPGAADRVKRLGLVVTLGTPYEGSWLAAVVADLAGVATGGVASSETFRRLIHLLLAGCQAVPGDGCGELRKRLDELVTMLAFVPGSDELHDLQPWPTGVRVETLASRVVLENIGGSLFDRGQSADLGDGLVSVASATAGDYPEKVPECRYPADLSRAVVDHGLVYHRRTAEVVETAQFSLPLRLSLGLFAQGATCGHDGQTRLIELTDAVQRAVADEVSRGEPIFAFTGRNGLSLVRDTKTVATLAGPECGARGQFYEPPVWTRDGRHVVAVSWRCEDDGLGPPNWTDNQVLVLNPSNPSASRRLTCGCAGVAAIEGARIAWVDYRGNAFKMDLATTDGPKPWRITLPTGLYAKEALAGIGGILLLHAIRARPGTEDFLASYVAVPGAILTVPPDGVAKLLREYAEIVSVDAAAASIDEAPGGRRFIYSTTDTFGDCAHPGRIWITDPAGAQPVATDASALTPNGGDVFMRDAWWGSDGRLYATLASSQCDPSGGKPIVAPSLWRLDNGRWGRVDAGPLESVRQLGPAIKVVVIGDGDLYVEKNGGAGTKIASGVYAIQAPPHLGPV